jgi:hypothetical protein
MMRYRFGMEDEITEDMLSAGGPVDDIPQANQVAD